MPSRGAGLVRYCEDPALAIDNNLSDRTLRPCAIGRRKWTFLGDDRGGRTAAVQFSCTANCKTDAVEPRPYLRDVVLRPAAARPSSSAERYVASVLAQAAGFHLPITGWKETPTDSVMNVVSRASAIPT